MADGDLVYSTDGGDHRRRSARPAPTTPPAPADGIVRVSRSRAGRKGKTVTLVTGLPGGEGPLRAAAADLKRLCGSGGSVRDGVVELQGDHRDRVAEHLRARGHVVRLAGG